MKCVIFLFLDYCTYQGAGLGRKRRGCWIWRAGWTSGLPGRPRVSPRSHTEEWMDHIWWVFLFFFCLFWTCRSLSSSIVAFRKSNKLGFFIKVIPQRDHDTDVVVSFKMRHDFRNLAAPTRPSEDGAETPAEPIWLTHHVDLSLGPLAPWTPVPTPDPRKLGYIRMYERFLILLIWNSSVVTGLSDPVYI